MSKSLFKWLAILGLAVLSLSAAFYLAGTDPGVEAVTVQSTEHVSNRFVDVNGDGAVDLIVSGEVIMNAEAPLASQ